MAQFRKDTHEFLNNGTTLFEVGMSADENGELWNRRYAKDAWNRPKSIVDRSVFSATWTFGIPARVWEEYQFDGATWTPQTSFSRATSVNKMLSVVSGTTPTEGATLATKQYSRYQPNRGHLYSTAVIMPNASDRGIRRFGLATPDDGVFFEMVGDGVDWDIFAGRRAYGSLASYVSIKSAILDKVPNFDPSKGHVYDIQYQWRGVGNYFFYVDLELVYVDEYLGTGTQLSMSDPALQPFYSAYTGSDGTQVQLLAGCVDVTSEGGQDERTLFGSVSSGLDLLTLGTADTPTAVLAFKVPRTANGSFNSRGAFLDKLSAFCASSDTITSVYAARDISATTVDAITWTAIPDSALLTASGNAAGALNTAFQTDINSFGRVFSEFTAKDTKTEIINTSKNSPFLATPGDIIVIAGTGLSSTGQLYAATLYYSEQI